MRAPLQWQRKRPVLGQTPLYTYEEISDSTLRVTRDNDGEIIKRDFSVGDRFITYKNKPVEMIKLNPNGVSLDHGYYIIVREIGGLKRKTDVSAQNQIDKIYFNQRKSELFIASSEVEAVDCYVEGSVKQVIINQYERDPKARKACIDHFGVLCQVCGFDFSKAYGPYGEGFIEVHHRKPLNEINGSYSVNPIEDLIPVCSNCHSIIHRGKEPLSIDGIKCLLSKI
jgi:predicted restriction endonuclease